MLVPPHQNLQVYRLEPWKWVHSDALMEFDSFMGSDLIAPIPEHHTEYFNEDEIFMEAR